jgi:hypothetical protein
MSRVYYIYESEYYIYSMASAAAKSKLGQFRANSLSQSK